MKRVFLLVIFLSVAARATRVALPAAPVLSALEKKLTAEFDAHDNETVPPEKHKLFLQEFRPEFEKAFAAAPPSPENEALRARVFVKLGDHKEAVANLQGALKTQPNDPTLRVSLGRTRLEEKDYAGALAEAKAVLEKDPDNEAAKFLKFESRLRVAPTSTDAGHPTSSGGQATQPAATGDHPTVVFTSALKHVPIVSAVPAVQSGQPEPKDGNHFRSGCWPSR